MSNDDLYNKAWEAVKALYHDESVDAETTRANLLTLLGEIETLIETLPESEDK